jgi:hypothetical protein
MVNNKNLVISCVGNNSLHKEWLKGEELNFDLMLIYYGEGKEEDYINDCKLLVKGKGFKFRLIEAFIQEYWNEIKHYEYISFSDDDLSGDAYCFNNLFNRMKEYDLWVAQPSLSHDSFINHKELEQNDNAILRYTSFVEIMIPTFNTNILNKIKHTINDTDSGWGLEFLWFDMLGAPKDKFAIIDETPIKHTKPFTGQYPPGVNPSFDWQKTVDKFSHTNHGIKFFKTIWKL